MKGGAGRKQDRRERGVEEVRSARCEVRSAKCEVRGARCEVRSARCEGTIYHMALYASDKLGQSTPFITYMLGVIDKALQGLTRNTTPMLKESNLIQYFLTLNGETKAFVAQAKSFTRKDYMQIFKSLSTATASRDLQAAVKSGVLKRMGEGNQARYGEVK